MWTYRRWSVGVFVLAQSFLPSTVRAQDCNLNGIPDEDELETCPGIDLVVLVDTSGSTSDDIEALCFELGFAIDNLREGGLTVNEEILLIGAGGNPCSCCTDTVGNVYGISTPLLPELLGDCAGTGSGEGELEDWAAATAIVAGNKEWTPWQIIPPPPVPAHLRIIVPASDEGPR